jgi:hypothetical protein
MEGKSSNNLSRSTGESARMATSISFAVLMGVNLLFRYGVKQIASDRLKPRPASIAVRFDDRSRGIHPAVERSQCNRVAERCLNAG